MPEILYTRRGISELLNIHPLTIRKWEKEGLIKPKYVGDKPRYYLSDFVKEAPKKQTQSDKP